MVRHLALALVCLGAAAPAQATPHATSVVSYDDKGKAGGGIFNPAAWLGAPDASVGSLGIGGNCVLALGVTTVDGPGADFIVSENAFYSGPPGSGFAEAVFVEVGSNGVDFARFPSAYYGPPVSPGPFGVINVGAYAGLAGATPPDPFAADPQDVVDAGGDAFDLADLASDPLVLAGKVELNAITQVRLVDVRDGVDRDSRGVVIHDPGAGSADPDGVTVIHHTGNRAARGPAVDVAVPKDGAFTISMDDPDGWTDLDPATVRLALWGIEVNLADLLPAMRLVRFDATGFTLKLAGPLPPKLLLRVSASVKDYAGNRSGDTRSRPM